MPLPRSWSASLFSHMLKLKSRFSYDKVQMMLIGRKMKRKGNATVTGFSKSFHDKEWKRKTTKSISSSCMYKIIKCTWGIKDQLSQIRYSEYISSLEYTVLMVKASLPYSYCYYDNYPQLFIYQWKKSDYGNKLWPWTIIVKNKTWLFWYKLMKYFQVSQL